MIATPEEINEAIANQPKDRVISIQISRREDGGLRVSSEDVPGLILSHPNPEQVMADIYPALLEIEKHEGYDIFQLQI